MVVRRKKSSTSTNVSGISDACPFSPKSDTKAELLPGATGKLPVGSWGRVRAIKSTVNRQPAVVIGNDELSGAHLTQSCPKQKKKGRKGRVRVGGGAEREKDESRKQ